MVLEWARRDAQRATSYSGVGSLLQFSLHDELALFVRGGMTPLEALQPATLNPAKSLNATDSFGTILS